MYWNKVFLFVFALFASYDCSLRVYFQKCASGGFTCTLSQNKMNVTYECPIGTTVSMNLISFFKLFSFYFLGRNILSLAIPFKFEHCSSYD